MTRARAPDRNFAGATVSRPTVPVRAFLVPLLLCAACAPVGVAAPEEYEDEPALPERESIAPLLATQPPADDAIARSSQPWSWLHSRGAGGDWLTPGAGGTSTELVNSPRRFVAWREGHVVWVRREQLDRAERVVSTQWSRRLGEDAVSEPVVLSLPAPPDPVPPLVAYRVAGGYALHALTREGAPRWTARVSDPELVAPVELQLDFGYGSWKGERLVVYNRGPASAFLDEVEIAGGRVHARARVDVHALHDQFPANVTDAVADRPLWREWSGADGDYAVRVEAGAYHLIARDAAGDERWRARVDEVEHPGFGRFALLEHGELIALALTNRSVSMATIYGLRREGGAVVSKVNFGGVGAGWFRFYDHALELAPGPGARVIAVGRGMIGSYVAVIMLDRGVLLGQETWRHG